MERAKKRKIGDVIAVDIGDVIAVDICDVISGADCWGDGASFPS